jgi:(E)-4-hydroxy-3-methyl-but-2-enyl pyrophosphate reductase
MKLRLAKEIGYCYGVRNAVEAAVEEARKRNGPVVTLGEIIHNEHAVQMLRDQHGVDTINRPDEIDCGTVVIRAHGVPPETYRQLENRGVTVVDATCPFVKKTHTIAKKLADEGFFIVILGKRDHPEVIGIQGAIGAQCVVVEKDEDLDQVPATPKIAVVFQSTTTVEANRYALGPIAERCNEMRVMNTICDVTINRIEQAERLAPHVNAILVIGGKNSSNTKKLATMCRQLVPRTYHIEDAGELGLAELRPDDTVGIITGTSTPMVLVEEVVRALQGRFPVEEQSVVA